MVHDFKPPFLDGKIRYTKQVDPVSVLKDPNCDMAILAKKGSKVLRA
jgi:pre-mRNA-splicing factor ATP-dependent RNA helicase DHX38/PRP16